MKETKEERRHARRLARMKGAATRAATAAGRRLGEAHGRIVELENGIRQLTAKMAADGARHAATTAELLAELSSLERSRVRYAWCLVAIIGSALFAFVMMWAGWL